MADRSVECWGENLSGEIGVPDQLEVLFATPVAGLGEVLAVTTGGAHTCAILADRTVSCWGSNQLNQLGRTSAENSGRCPGTLYNTVASCSATPTPVAALTNVVSVAAGSWHTCALIDDGTVKCWGANNFGQLGDGSIGGSVATPVMVSGLHGVVALSVGSFHSCALLDNGNVYCWGYNQFGQVGNGDTLDQAAAVRVNL
jgi:alpha-tubulin suppressor-like RCC1 family protein